MGWGRKLLAAATGTMTGLAEVAEKEDETRKDLTKTVLNTAITRWGKLEDERAKSQAKIDAEDAAVKALSEQPIQLKDGGMAIITEAQARKAIQRYGAETVNSMILQKQISFSGAGEVKAGAGQTRELLNLEQIQKSGEAMGQTGGLFSKDRYKSVSENTTAMLQAMGIDPKSVVIPTDKEVSGVQIFTGPGTDKVSKESLYTDIPGISGKMVNKVTRQSIDGKLTTSYLDLLGNDVTEIITQGLQDKKSDYKLVTNFSDLQDDMNIRTSGMAFQVTDTGKITPLNFDVVYTKDGGVFRKGDSGRYDVPVTEKNIMTLPSSIVTALGDDVTDVFDALGKTGRKAFEDFNAQAEAFGRATHVVSNQMELLNEHGNALVADVGAFATFKDYVMSNFGVALEFVEGQQFLELDDGNRAILQNKRDQYLKNLDTETDPKKRLATAIRLYQANQILFAYASARAVTNDTRISNQDFDLFFKTVSGDTAVTQKAIYHNRLADAKIAVNEMYTSLKSVVDASGNESAKNVLTAIPESRTASGMDCRIIEVMGTDTPERTIQEVQEESTDIRNVYDKVEVRLEKVNPNTFQIDPNGVEAYVAYANGKRMITTNDDVVLTTDIANTTKDDLKREALGMLQNKLIK